MPANETQWAMFLFFAVGAAGGVLYLAQLAVEFIAAARLRRDIERTLHQVEDR